MDIVLDTHTHTIACNHAYCTITENVQEAKNKNLELICITEHGPSMPGGPHKYFFANIKVVPPKIDGVKILKGIEANILNYDGQIDLPTQYEEKMEIVLAGLHHMCLTPGSKKENTRTIIKTMEREIVDVIVHIGNPVYEIDYDDFIKAAKDTNTLIEINNSSFVHTRYGSHNNCLYVAEKCMENEILITLGSDAHFACDIGNFDKAIELLNSIEFPKELIINTSVNKLTNYLESKGKMLFVDPRLK